MGSLVGQKVEEFTLWVKRRYLENLESFGVRVIEFVLAMFIFVQGFLVRVGFGISLVFFYGGEIFRCFFIGIFIFCFL